MRKIVQLILVVVIFGLVYVIYNLIATPVTFEVEKARIEKSVVDQIKNIRLAERAYKSKYQSFTGDFDELINFVLNDSLQMDRKIVDEDDSVGMAQLRLSGRKNVESFFIPVRDTVFSPSKLSQSEIKSLRYVPGVYEDVEFSLAAGKITTESKVVIPVVECKIPYKFYLDTLKYRQQIINLIDNDVNNYNKYPGIKFGSMEGGNNEAGNWE